MTAPFSRSRPLLMGIVNVTPDSFSDGGRHLAFDAALAHARQLIADGADILDIGGESTRPGAEPVSEADEMARVAPLVAAIRAETAIPISVDTMKPAVARIAMTCGATIWNDVAALGFAPDSMALAAALDCEVVLMHMQGEPRTMQDEPRYEDVVGEVEAWLLARAEAAVSAGVKRERIMLDPGLGFGKTTAHNLALLAATSRLAGHGYPLLVGASRKRFIGALDPRAKGPEDRLGGSIAAALKAADGGCAILRVHDVRETRQALAVWTAPTAES